MGLLQLLDRAATQEVSLRSIGEDLLAGLLTAETAIERVADAGRTPSQLRQELLSIRTESENAVILSEAALRRARDGVAIGKQCVDVAIERLKTANGLHADNSTIADLQADVDRLRFRLGSLERAAVKAEDARAEAQARRSAIVRAMG